MATIAGCVTCRLCLAELKQSSIASPLSRRHHRDEQSSTKSDHTIKNDVELPPIKVPDFDNNILLDWEIALTNSLSTTRSRNLARFQSSLGRDLDRQTRRCFIRHHNAVVRPNIKGRHI